MTLTPGREVGSNSHPTWWHPLVGIGIDPPDAVAIDLTPTLPASVEPSGCPSMALNNLRTVLLVAARKATRNGFRFRRSFLITGRYEHGERRA